MSKQASYRDIGGLHGLAARKEPFEGNTMSASWSNGGLYWVYSYSTPIAVYDPTDDTVYVNTWNYSVTTARHKGALAFLRYHATYEVDVWPDSYLPQGAYTALRNAVEQYRPQEQPA